MCACPKVMLLVNADLAYRRRPSKGGEARSWQRIDTSDHPLSLRANPN